MLTQRLVGVILITSLLSACAAIERGRSAPTSTDVRLEAASHSAPGSASDNRIFQSDSMATALEEIGAGPKTDRAVGIVALVTVLAVFTMILIGLYKLATVF